jgi:arylsulfatase A-like enzyme
VAQAPSYLNRPASGIFLLLAALALPAVTASAGETRLPSCPGCNIILISLSNVGAGRMSLYGYPRKTTPRLDRWAKKSVVFERAFTPASWTLPVGVSLFTSLQPYSHGVLRRNLQNSLDPGTSTLPELLRDHGYRTAAFTGGLDYYPGFSHMRGFQDAPDNGEFAGFAQSIPQAQSWLKKNASERFFLFLHGYEAHCPFSPSKKYRGRFSGPGERSALANPDFCVRGYEESPAPNGPIDAVSFSGNCSGFRTHCAFGPKVRLTPRDISDFSDMYDEELLEVDALVGSFLESLDAELLKKTVVVVFSDHGEIFAKHGRFGRLGNVRGTLFEDAVRVPLVMRFPGGPGRKFAGLAQLIDVMPTILKVLDVPMPEGRQGVDLSSAIASGSGSEPNDYAYAGAVYGPHPVYYPFWTENDMIRDRRWKLIQETVFKTALPLVKPPREVLRKTAALYDLEQDPQELRDISAEHPDVAADLRGKLGDWKTRMKGFSSQPPATQPFPEEMLQKARKRGYW